MAKKKRTLSERELEVLQLIVNGFTDEQVASKLNISANTASFHRKNLLDKLDATNVAVLVAEAIRNGHAK